MGAHYAFECTACGYRAEVSGRVDVGMTCRSATIRCRTCKKLRDVVVSEEPWKEPPDPIPEHPACPGSRTRKHVTELWTAPGPCPRCDAQMEGGELVLLWD